MDVAWYLNRLRLMDGRELLHRVRERATLRELEKSQASSAIAANAVAPGTFAFCTATKPVLPRLEWNLAANEARAAELLDGHWSALGHPWRFSETSNCWHRAPDTGAVWPTVYFGRIPYRHGNPFGDARVVWEPSRLQQLVSLALLGARTKHRDRAVALFERQLESWVNANPPYCGIHYVSAMECALRLIAVCHSVDLLRNCLADRRSTWRRVVGIVASHARLIERRLSLYSSASNHTIAEAAGLIYAGALFPELERAAQWLAAGAEILSAQYCRQVLPDGGGAEHAPSYLSLITDLALLSQRLLAATPLANAINSERIDLSRRYLDEISAPGAALPALGDSDSGVALSPFLRRSRLHAGDLRPRVLFPNTGCTVLRSRGTPARQILFDHGPLGMAPMYQHAHADALSITLRESDVDLLIDPGTYSYSAQEWRRYFRSTAAHNTVTVDERDQALQTAPFIWRHPFECRLVKYQGGDHALTLAMHRGYRRSGVTHWRGLVYDHDGRLVIWDYLTGEGSHRLALRWHLGVDATLDGDVALANDHALALRIVGATQLTRYRGSVDPIAGWQSPAYGVKAPATTIDARHCGTLPHAFLTVIDLAPNGARLEPDARELEHLATLRSWIDEA